MTSTVSFAWHGVQDFERAITRALTEVPRGYTAEGLTSVARRLREQAGALAGHKTGRMAEEWAVLGPMFEGNTASLQTGPVAPYARRQELGYRGGGSGKGHGASPAHPYMRPALEALVPEVNRLMAVAWNPARWAHG